MFTIVVDATVFCDLAGGIGVIAIRAAVFGDFDWKPIVFRDPLDDVVHAARIDLPANLGEWSLFSHGNFKAHRIVGNVGGCRRCGSRDQPTEVIVDADIVERGRHPLLIAALKAHGLKWSAVNEGFRIAATKRGFEKPDVVESVEAPSGSCILGRRGERGRRGHAEGAAYL